MYVPPVQYSRVLSRKNKSTQVRSLMDWSCADPPWETDSMQLRMDIDRGWNHLIRWVGVIPSDRMKVVVPVKN